MLVILCLRNSTTSKVGREMNRDSYVNFAFVQLNTTTPTTTNRSSNTTSAIAKAL